MATLMKAKPEQEQAVNSLMNGKDVLAVLPTGFGKSFIYQDFSEKKNISDGASLVLVIAPLSSIIRDQISNLNSKSPSNAAELSSLSSEELKTCNFKMLFSSAEDVLGCEFTEELKNSGSELHKRLSLIVVDETHTVETWSGKRCRLKKKKNRSQNVPFRSAYGRLAILRSLCREDVPVLALTATADRTTQEVICKELLLKSPEKIIVSPHRENLRFSICKWAKEDMHKGLDWLVDLAKEKGIDTPKTIIFCNTITEVSAVVNWLLVKLGKHSYCPTTSTNKEHLIIGIYHSMSWQANKENIMKSLSDNGLKRIIVATTALSMGVNFPDIRYILNWGPARTLLDQHQEAGRAGRDGELSHVIINYYGQQLSHCEEDVKNFVKSNDCFRIAAYKPFDDAIKPLEVPHECCSNCARTCSCEKCEIPLHEKQSSGTKIIPKACRTVSEEDKQCVKDAFLEIREAMPQSCRALGETTSHAFSLELVESIVEHCQKLFTIDDIHSYLPVFSLKHGLKILEVLDEIFADIPELDSTMNIMNDFVLQSFHNSLEYQDGTTDESEPFIYEEELHSFTDYLGISDSNSDTSGLSDIDFDRD